MEIPFASEAVARQFPAGAYWKQRGASGAISRTNFSLPNFTNEEDMEE